VLIEKAPNQRILERKDIPLEAKARLMNLCSNSILPNFGAALTKILPSFGKFLGNILS
jgi:hypothetical protein